MVISAGRRALQRVLNGALAVEARSALAYALQVSEGRESVLAPDAQKGLTALRSQLGTAATRLANLILEHGGTPDPGNYPLVVTNYNYLDVATLLARIEGSVPGDAAKLDALAQALTEPADVRELLLGLAKQKREQHRAVQGLQEKLRPKPQPAEASAPASGASGAPAKAGPQPKPKMTPEEAQALAAKKKAEVEAKKAAAAGGAAPATPPAPTPAPEPAPHFTVP